MLLSSIVVLAFLYLAAGLLFLARRKPGYRHLRHTISEIGESGAPDERLVAVGLFLPIGLALLVPAWLVQHTQPATSALAACIAAGYLGAAAFPCDPGSPRAGSARQAMHNLAGAIEYAGGGFALMTLAETGGQVFRIAGFLVLGTAVALTVLPSGGVRGLIQRVGELALFGALAWALQAA